MAMGAREAAFGLHSTPLLRTPLAFTPPNDTPGETALDAICWDDARVAKAYPKVADCGYFFRMGIFLFLPCSPQGGVVVY